MPRLDDNLEAVNRLYVSNTVSALMVIKLVIVAGETHSANQTSRAVF